MTDWFDDLGVKYDDAPPEKVKKEKLNDFAGTIARIDNGDKKYYSTLSPEQKKDLSMWVMMRAVSSSKTHGEHFLMLVNELVNENFSVLSKHQELQWKLLCLCGIGKQYHPWIAPPKKGKKDRIEEILIGLHPLLKSDDLDLLRSVNTNDELKSYFKDAGISDEDIKEAFSGV
jgi:hypothetical protein